MPGPFLQRNPPLQRFKYVAKMYGGEHPDAVLDTFFSLADTVGIENPAREFDAVRQWDELRNEMSRVSQRRWRGETEYSEAFDRRQSRKAREILQQLLVELEDDPRMRQGRETDKLWPWLARELVRLKKSGALGENGFPGWMQGSNSVDGKGSAIALWQRQNRIDLGQWRIPSVLEALEDFELEQRGDIPQGEVVYEFGDGWSVQRLVDPEQLKVEGEVMQHCVGAYCPAVAAGETIIYSLRDPKGRPHATMEAREGFRRFIQVQGKQNREPTGEYQERVDEFAVSRGITLPSDRLTSEEYDKAFEYGVQCGVEGWEEEIRCVNAAISLKGEGYDGGVINYYDIIGATTIEGDSEDWEDLELAAKLEEAALEGATEAWDEALERAQGELADVIDEVVTAAQEEIDEGADPNDLDLEYAVHMALENTDLPWSQADLRYAVGEAAARTG